MARIKPFKGVRPPRQFVEEVASRPYDVLNSEEARKATKKAFTTSSNLKSILNPDLTSMILPYMTKRWKTSVNFRKTDGWCKTTKRIIISMPRQ